MKQSSVITLSGLLAGRFTCEYVGTRLEFQRKVGDQGEVFNAQRRQHDAKI